MLVWREHSWEKSAALSSSFFIKAVSSMLSPSDQIFLDFMQFSENLIKWKLYFRSILFKLTCLEKKGNQNQELPDRPTLHTGHRNAQAKHAPQTPNATQGMQEDLLLRPANLTSPVMTWHSAPPSWIWLWNDPPKQPPPPANLHYKAKNVRPRSWHNTARRVIQPQLSNIWENLKITVWLSLATLFWTPDEIVNQNTPDPPDMQK